jgi:hypothetical protein
MATRRTSTTRARTSDKPAPISINLDTLEREVEPEPFVAVLDNHRYVMADAFDIDWKVLALAERDTRTFFKAVLSTEDFKRITGTNLPGWKLRALMDAYRTHFGLVETGESSASSA